MLKRLLFLLLLIVGVGYSEEIKSYETHLRVNQDGTLNITEKILYDFGSNARHGIFRDIPVTIKSKSGRIIDLGFSGFKIQMDGKSIPYSITDIYSSSSGKMVRLKIGSPSYTVRGSHLYTISYRVQKGVMIASKGDLDAIRWNLLGTGWKVAVKEFKAFISLPATLNRDIVEVDYWRGIYGSKDRFNTQVKWIDKNSLELISKDLAPHEGVTIELRFPVGALGQTGKENIELSPLDSFLNSLPLPITILSLFYLYILAKRYGFKSGRGSISARYYPPKGVSLLQSGLILDRFSDKKDLSGAIVELATKGYIVIHNDSLGSWLSYTKKDNEEDLTKDQKYLLHTILFNQSDIFNIDNLSLSAKEELLNKFSTLDNILYYWSVEDGYMEQNPQRARLKFLLYSLLVAIPASIFMIFIMFKSQSYTLDMLIPFIFLLPFMGVGLMMLYQALKRNSIIQSIFALIWITTTLIILYASTPFSLSNLIFGIPGFILLIFIAIFYFYRNVGTFTKKGRDLHLYLLGYKEFIKRVEKDRIKRFLKQDPNYLDKNIPYAMLFGVSDAWASLYEELGLSSPNWYIGSWYSFSDFSDSFDKSLTPPASESGGFSGGGDFSGGGGGGGGGDSW